MSGKTPPKSFAQLTPAEYGEMRDSLIQYVALMSGNHAEVMSNLLLGAAGKVLGILMANMPSFKVSRLRYMADTLVTNTLRWRDAVKPLSPEEKLDV